MGNKKKTSWTEAVNDAVTGYSVVILSVVCFLIALAVVVGGIRVIAGSGSTTTTAAAASTASASATSTGKAA